MKNWPGNLYSGSIFIVTTVQQPNIYDQIQAEELQAAEKIAHSFISAFKYYSLYPEGHSFSSKYQNKFKNELNEFLEKYKKLRLDISKNSFSYKGETLFVGIAEENNPAYLFSRDRVLFLEFTSNIEPAEISQLLDILKRHRNPLDDTEGDIATTLWHYRFGHIHYEAADIFAMEAIQFELSMFKAAPSQENRNGQGETNGSTGEFGHGNTAGNGTSAPGQGHQGQVLANNTTSEHEHYSSPGENVNTPSSLLLLAKNKDLAELAPEEKKMLAFMIKKEEERDFTSDVIDILLITLTVEPDQMDFAGILEFLEFEFFDAMIREDFPLALKICKNVINISEAVKSKKPWALSLINIFLVSLAREDRFAEMPWLLEYRRIAANPGKNVELLSTLQLLPPDIILVLGTLVSQIAVENIHLRHKIVEIISVKVKSNPEPLGRLVEKSGEETILLMLPVAEHLESDRAALIYLQMTRHPSPTVRREGMDGFFRTNKSPGTNEILPLLHDQDKYLRERVLTYLEQLNPALRENLLISFLSQDTTETDDELFIMHCYRLLSGCLSSGSEKFLEKILLGSDLKTMFDQIRKAHKTGAAYALRTMGTRDAMQVLQKGLESLRPDVHQVCKKALES